MGSHYIPVGKLKIDQSILDIACPAAGYGTTPPDPAIYCPANGFIKDPTAWVAPVEMVTPSDNQILLLCDDMEQGVISLFCQANSGLINFELLTDAMVVIYSTTFSSSINYIFPTYRAGTYYIIRLSPVTSGSYIKTFYSAYAYTGFTTNWRILKAIFNTPGLITGSNLFKGIKSFRECIFSTSMNSLTTLQYAFSTSGIEKVTWPSEMNALTNIQYLFEYTTNIKVVDLSGISLNSLITYNNLIQFSSVNTFIFPDTLDNANTTLLGCLVDAGLLISIVLPTSMTGVIMITNMCRNCKMLEGDIIFPAMPNLVGVAAFYMTNVRKVQFTGPSDLVTNTSSIIQYCDRFEELVLPTSMNGVTSIYNTVIQSSLTKLVLPLSMTSMSSNWNGASTKGTEEITKCDAWGTASLYVTIYSIKLTYFDQPTLRAVQLTLGTTAEKTKVTYVEIDWVNSSYADTSPQIGIYGELDATELDRIYTALPTVVGKTFKASYNPGYVTSTPAIATAKGWTVS